MVVISSCSNRMNASALASDTADKPVLVITGMHRSATSLAAAVCQRAGLFIGDSLLGAAVGNPHGHYEDVEFLEFHKRVLRANGRCQDGLFADGIVRMPSRLRPEARTLIAKRKAVGRPWGWKDPRTTLLLKFWRHELPLARYLFLFRSPWEVVDSLFRRGVHEFLQTNPALALAIWERYNRDIRDFARSHPEHCLVVEARQIVREPHAVVRNLRHKFGIDLVEKENDYREGLFTSLENSPRAEFVRTCSPEAATLYAELQELAGAVSAGQAKRKTSMHAAKDLLQHGMLDWATVREQERSIADLQRTLGDTLAGQAQLAGRSEELDRQLRESQAALESLRQRSDALEAAAGAAERKIADLEQECATHRDRAARLEDVERQIVESQAALESSRQRSDALEAAAGAAERKIADLERDQRERNEMFSHLRCRLDEQETNAARLTGDLNAVDQDRERLLTQVRELSAHVAEWQSYARAAAEDCDKEQKATMELRSHLLASREAGESMRAELASILAERNSLQMRVAECEAEARDSRQRAESQAREMEHFFAEQRMILGSNSWRLTRPLRELRRWITHPRRQVSRYFGATAADGRSLHPEQPAQPVSQTDGECGHTAANAGEQLVRPASDAGTAALSGMTAASPSPARRAAVDPCRLIAFYLPQYHRIQENDDWWGPGFTEWTNVARGRSNFDGHYQPHVPRELGFYDLTQPDVLRRQAEMARLYGITGFCFYHYWFSGRRVLEKPLEQFLASDIELEFCICWANENWTRSWDGDTKTVLLEQRYEPGDAERFFRSVEHVLQDRRYIRVDGKPFLVVYRAKDIPKPKEVFATWRRLAREAGLGGLHIAVVDFYDISDPAEVDADSLVEFPPHKFNGPVNVPDVVPPITNPAFCGGILDYRKIIAQSVHKAAPAFTYFRGILPSWDNTARRQDSPTTIIHSTPEWYAKWLAYLRSYTRQHTGDSDKAIIFVNAWNEWGEGCHLEPDVKWGLQYLESTFRTRLYEPAVSHEISTSSLHAELAAALAAGKHPPMINSAAPHATNGHGSAPVTNGVYYRPVSERVHRIATSLRKYPVVYSLARSTYRSYRRLRG
ncbi:MAG: glycoside hydrolase family 99-like domain-containing protein [Planctomycetia bacterium]